MAKKHIHLFETEAQFSGEYTGSGYTEPWVSLTRTVDRVDYNKPIWLDLTGDNYPENIDGHETIREPRTWPGNDGDVVYVKEPNGDVKEYVCQGRIRDEWDFEGPHHVDDHVSYSRYLSEEEKSIYGCDGFGLAKWFQLDDQYDLPLVWIMVFNQAT